ESGGLCGCANRLRGDALIRFSVKFYLIAMLFLIFDLEVVFLYPWAIYFRQLGVFGLVQMGIFLGILTIGYVYVWKKGALDWDCLQMSETGPQLSYIRERLGSKVLEVLESQGDDVLILDRASL